MDQGVLGDTFAALMRIADEIQPQQDRLRAAWSRFMSANGNGAEEHRLVCQVIAEVNAAIAVHAQAIADATQNSVGNIRTFGPLTRHGVVVDPTRVWFDDLFPADFLRGVAKYRSFNQASWGARGWRGFVSPPVMPRQALSA